jgi:hypothetical protein
MACDEKVVFSCDGTELVSLEANLEEQGIPVGGSVLCSDIAGMVRIRLDAASEQFGGTVVLIRDGGVRMVNGSGQQRVIVTNGDPVESQDGGMIELSTAPPEGSSGGASSAILLNASERALTLLAADGTKVLTLSGIDQNALEVHDSAGRAVLAFKPGNAALYLGAKGNEGDVVVLDGKGADRIHLNGAAGEVLLRDNTNRERIAISGRDASLVVRGPDAADRIALLGALSQIIVRSAEGKPVLSFSGLDATVGVGGTGQAGSIAMFDAKGKETLSVDGAKGDIILQNADCAEEFEIADGVEIEPATVMVIEEDGFLVPSSRPYDTAVAGVVSGGGGERPGIVFGHQRSAGRRLPIALAGRVYCNVDTRGAPVSVGDLLTTSDTPGHAMKAAEPRRAFGSVLGKALRPLHSGRGAIPVLVALQ